MKLNHYFTPQRQAHDADFEWSFTADAFVLRKGIGPIPNELVVRLLGTEGSVDEIRGRWKVLDANRLVLTEISAAGQKVNAEVTFPISRTAPTVIRVGNPQYVFGLLP